MVSASVLYRSRISYPTDVTSTNIVNSHVSAIIGTYRVPNNAAYYKAYFPAIDKSFHATVRKAISTTIVATSKLTKWSAINCSKWATNHATNNPTNSYSHGAASECPVGTAN